MDSEPFEYFVPRRKLNDREEDIDSPFPFLKQTRNLLNVTADHSSTLEKIERQFAQSNSFSARGDDSETGGFEDEEEECNLADEPESMETYHKAEHNNF